MADEDKNKPGQPELSLRPDPVFKQIVGIDAVKRGMVLLETQFPQLLTADLLLYVPPGLPLDNTKYGFFHTYTMIDFKSENDDFDEREYTKNEIRVDALYLQKEDIKKSDILNLFICSYKPLSFFKAMREQGCSFKQAKDRKWLWQAKVGLQYVAVVVCRDLPFEPEYFRWLAFAPSTHPNWQKLVAALVRTGADWELLKTLEKMKPQEVGKIMTDTLKELFEKGDYSPEFKAQFETNDALADKIFFTALLKDMPPEIFAMVFDVNKIFARVYAEKLRTGSPTDELLASIPAEMRLASIPVEVRLASVPAEERLAGLSPEEKQKLLKALQGDESINKE